MQKCYYLRMEVRGEKVLITVTEKVRFVETDAMGVAHHSNYFRWFEMGRVEFLKQHEISLNDLLNSGIVFPITAVECQYKHSAKFDDVIIIKTVLETITPVKMIFSYQVFRADDNVLLALGKTQNVFTNKAGRITKLPPEIYQKIKQ